MVEDVSFIPLQVLRKISKTFELMRKKTDDRMDLVANMIAGNVNQTIDGISYGVFVVSPDESHKNGKRDGKGNINGLQ